jgi:hypothetical protein
MKFKIESGKKGVVANCADSMKFIQKLQDKMDKNNSPSLELVFNPKIDKAGRYHIAIHTLLKYMYFEVEKLHLKKKPHPKYGELSVSYDEFKKFFIVKAGFFTATLAMNGSIKAIPQSLSPDSLPYDKAEGLYKKLVPILADKAGVSIKQLMSDAHIWGGKR